METILKTESFIPKRNLGIKKVKVIRVDRGHTGFRLEEYGFSNGIWEYLSTYGSPDILSIQHEINYLKIN